MRFRLASRGGLDNAGNGTENSELTIRIGLSLALRLRMQKITTKYAEIGIIIDILVEEMQKLVLIHDNCSNLCNIFPNFGRNERLDFM